MKYVKLFLLLLLSLPILCSCDKEVEFMQSTRKERKLIEKGNNAFYESKYQDAANYYREALTANPSSPEALYNNALATMVIAEQMKAKGGEQPDSAALQLEDEAIQMYMKASMLRDRATGIASLACYNLGNHYFRSDKLDDAEIYYRQSLRLNPAFDEARRNLRITQLKKEQQNKDDKKDQNQQDKQDNQDQNDQKDQNDNNQDNKEDKNNQQPQPQSNMTPQAAQQILNANSSKEQSTRARIERSQQQQQQKGSPRGKKW